jgi:hypothetical protein
MLLGSIQRHVEECSLARCFAFVQVDYLARVESSVPKGGCQLNVTVSVNYHSEDTTVLVAIG